MSLSNSIRPPITTRNLLRRVRSLPLNIVRAFVLPLCVFTCFGSRFARRPIFCPGSGPICIECPFMIIIVGLLPDHVSDPLTAYSRSRPLRLGCAVVGPHRTRPAPGLAPERCCPPHRHRPENFPTFSTSKLRNILNLFIKLFLLEPTYDRPSTLYHRTLLAGRVEPPACVFFFNTW
jgi:hypothetical protein